MFLAKVIYGRLSRKRTKSIEEQIPLKHQESRKRNTLTFSWYCFTICKNCSTASKAFDRTSLQHMRAYIMITSQNINQHHHEQKDKMQLGKVMAQTRVKKHNIIADYILKGRNYHTDYTRRWIVDIMPWSKQVNI